jgi:hypothetical protein
MGRALKRVAKSFTVRVSPLLAAEMARKRGHHHDLSPDEKEAKLRKLIDYDFSKIIQDGVIKQRTHYNRLASCYFPHMASVRAGGKRTPLELFNNHPLLIKAMEKRQKLHIGSKVRSKAELAEEKQIRWLRDFLPESLLTAPSIQKALRTYSGTQGVSNFSPVAAAAIYHELLPDQGGVTWDMSCGWGGRLLGAIACKKVRTYIGCDPSTETYKGLLTMRDELLPMARSMGRNLDVEPHMLGSEMMRPNLEPNSVDLCFSSPPYFAQEQYSDEDTQSWKKFSTHEAWMTGFVGTTLDNCAYCLKPDGLLAVNIADVSSHPTLAQEFVEYAEGHGWKLIKTRKLALSVMPGTRQKQKGKFKHEPIFIFRRK